MKECGGIIHFYSGFYESFHKQFKKLFARTSIQLSSEMAEVINLGDEIRRRPSRLSSHNMSNQNAILTNAIRSDNVKRVLSRRMCTAVDQEYFWIKLTEIIFVSAVHLKSGICGNFSNTLDVESLRVLCKLHREYSSSCGLDFHAPGKSNFKNQRLAMSALVYVPRFPHQWVDTRLRLSIKIQNLRKRLLPPTAFFGVGNLVLNM